VLWIIPEATHGTNFYALSEEYAAKMLAFFVDALIANK
jgi:hypothetical protein